jgi:GNAT superfamily N-acetyltransferase
MEYYFVCNKASNKYEDAFRTIDCIEGNREDLIRQVRENERFCRDQTAISYLYFLQTLNTYTCLYIKKRDEDQILGCCSISMNGYITIYGICVPDGTIKRIGTLLINKLKEFVKRTNLEGITLSASKSVQDFYKKNGFTLDTHDSGDAEYNEFLEMTSGFTSTSMTYHAERSTGGKHVKTKINKSKRNKTKKVNKRIPKNR